MAMVCAGAHSFCRSCARRQKSGHDDTRLRLLPQSLFEEVLPQEFSASSCAGKALQLEIMQDMTCFLRRELVVVNGAGAGQRRLHVNSKPRQY